MVPADSIAVEVVYALAERQVIVRLEVAPNATIDAVISIPVLGIAYLPNPLPRGTIID